MYIFSHLVPTFLPNYIIEERGSYIVTILIVHTEYSVKSIANV